MLAEIPLSVRPVDIPAAVEEFAAEGKRRSKAIDVLCFVSSSHAHVYRVLDTLERGTFCEWGSGTGVNVGVATLLGFKATGIEIEPALADTSRQLLADFRLDATILTGSYYEIEQPADYYYVYCWPGQMETVLAHFEAHAPATAKLLICYGSEDIRCKVKSADPSERPG